MNLQTTTIGLPTISSRDIARITGKPHSDVLKDVRRILEEVQIGLGQFSSSYLNAQNKPQPCFVLPRRECDLVISGYSAKYRLAIIDRWRALEAKQPVVPVFDPTDSDAMVVYLHQMTSVAMHRAEQNKLLSDKLDRSEDNLRVTESARLAASSALATQVEATSVMEETVRATRESETMTVSALVAKIEAPNSGVTITEFFKQNEAVLGYSTFDGFTYLRETGVILKPKKNDWGRPQYKPSARWADCGYFQIKNQKFDRHMRDANGHKTGVTSVEHATTLYLTPDKRNKAGEVVSIGGYSWLLERMMLDFRTQLKRLIAETGGSSGTFKKLDGCILWHVNDPQLPGLDRGEVQSVIVSESPVGWVCGHRTKDGRVFKSKGPHIRQALENLNSQL